jgi:cell division protein FtsN
LYAAISNPASPVIVARTRTPQPIQPEFQPVMNAQTNLYASSATDYWIQVGSYVLLENAEYAQRQLMARNISSQVTLTRGYNQSFFRLQAGPFRTEALAQQCLADIRRSQWGFFATDIP